MSLSQEQALSILRKHAEGNQKQFVYGAWFVLCFVAMFALIGLIDAMPMWQAGLSCGVLGLVALGLWLRGTGRLGTNVPEDLHTRQVPTSHQGVAQDEEAVKIVVTRTAEQEAEAVVAAQEIVALNGVTAIP